MTSQGNNFDCLIAMSPSHAQCHPVMLYVYAQIAQQVGGFSRFLAIFKRPKYYSGLFYTPLSNISLG